MGVPFPGLRRSSQMVVQQLMSAEWTIGLGLVAEGDMRHLKAGTAVAVKLDAQELARAPSDAAGVFALAFTFGEA